MDSYCVFSIIYKIILRQKRHSSLLLVDIAKFLISKQLRYTYNSNVYVTAVLQETLCSQIRNVILDTAILKGREQILAVNLSKSCFLFCKWAKTHSTPRKSTMYPCCNASRSVALQIIHRYPDGNVQGLARVFQHVRHARESGAVASLLQIDHRYLHDGGVALQHRVHRLQEERR